MRRERVVDERVYGGLDRRSREGTAVRHLAHSNPHMTIWTGACAAFGVVLEFVRLLV